MDYAMENGMDAWALTDHGHMNSYAHAQFHQWDLNKKGKDFKYIPGVEFYLHPDLKQWSVDFAAAQAKKTKGGPGEEESEGVIVENESESKQTKWYDPVRRRHHLVVIPKSHRGLQNLFTLVSRSYSEGFYKYPRIDYRMLKEHGEDLIVSTACLAGPMSYEIMKHHQLVKWEDLRPGIDTKQSFEAIQRELHGIVDKIVDAVGIENFSLELQFNKLAAQHLVNQHLIALSKTTGVKLIATADSHYPRPHMWKDRELYKKLGWMGSDKFEVGMLPQSTDELECELYPKNAEQMWQAYKDSTAHLSHRYPDINWRFYDDDVVADAIEKTHDIAHGQIGKVDPDTTVKLPSFVVEAGKSDFQTLVMAVRQGMERRGLAEKQQYIHRAKEELDIIRKKDFARYFLTMKSIMDTANENMLTGVGRGSGAGSLVNYVLGITGVDPIKYDLLFARFISMGREEYPDVDCLDSRHLIKLSDGSLLAIGQLEIGDTILDMNGDTREVQLVVTRPRKDDEIIYRLLVKSNDIYGVIVCTSEHRLVLHDGTFLKAQDVEIGNHLHGHPRPSVVLEKHICEHTQWLTDITVKENHTFQLVPFDVESPTAHTTTNFQEAGYTISSHNSDVADNDTLKHLLRQKFGTENVLPISNYNTLQLKSLLKDVSKFYGISFDEVNLVTKGLEQEVMKATMKKGDDKNVFVLTYDAAYEHAPRFRDFIDKHPHVGEHIKVLFKQNKSIGRHAGGVIIAEDIQRQMPVIKVRGEAQTPWTEGLNFRHLQELGWIKFDLLGLKTLRIIDRAIRLIIKRQWEEIDGMYTLKLGNDTFEVSGNTIATLRDGTSKPVKEITSNDDIIQLSDLWKES